MTHVTDRQLQDLVSTWQSGSRQTRAHLAACTRCRRRLDELQEIWDALGEWEVETAADLRPRVLMAATCRRRVILPSPSHVPWHRAAGIAASIAFAVTIGSVLGRMNPVGVSPSASPTTQQQAIADGLHLDLLARCDTRLAGYVDHATSFIREDVR